MDKNILIQFTDMRKEVKNLQERIEKLDRKANIVIIDSVRGSSDSYPYIEHNFTIEGKDLKTTDLLDRYKKLLKNACNNLLDVQNKVEEYIQSISDSRTRQILRYRYIDDHSWTKIGHLMNFNADGVRMEHKRFLDKN